MNIRRIIGIVIILCGGALIGVSLYIDSQVAQGKELISSAQKKINKGNNIFSLNPITKEIGKQATGSAQKKINAANDTVAYYEDLSQKAMIGGIIIAIVGVGLTFYPQRKKAKKRR